jgi:hypothetical protein
VKRVRAIREIGVGDASHKDEEARHNAVGSGSRLVPRPADPVFGFIFCRVPGFGCATRNATRVAFFGGVR